MLQSSLQQALSHLEAPWAQEERAQQDSDPRRFAELDQAQRHPLNRSPAGKAALSAERARLEQHHEEMMRAAATRQFAQRLEQRLALRPAHADAPFMARLMALVSRGRLPPQGP